MQITSCPLLSSRRASAVIAFKCPTGAGTVTAIRIVKYYQASISVLDVGDLAFVDPGFLRDSRPFLDLNERIIVNALVDA
jgi:hypothetical protein